MNWSLLTTAASVSGLAVTDANTFYVSSGVSVLRTTDGGATFTAAGVAQGLPSSEPTKLVVDRLPPPAGSMSGPVAMVSTIPPMEALHGDRLTRGYRSEQIGAGGLEQAPDGTLYATVVDNGVFPSVRLGIYRRQPADAAWQDITTELPFVIRSNTDGVRVGPNGVVYGKFSFFGVQKRDSVTGKWSPLETAFASGRPPYVSSLWVDATNRVYSAAGNTAVPPRPPGGMGLFTSDDGVALGTCMPETGPRLQSPAASPEIPKATCILRPLTSNFLSTTPKC